MTNAQTEKLFSTFITAILEKCADELDVSVDFLREAYVSNAEVRNDLNNIFARHIEVLGEAA